MAHYALLNQNNIVINVIVGEDENKDNIDWEIYYSNLFNCVVKRTSYNTYQGQHTQNGIPFRANYAKIGQKYYTEYDIFADIQPYPSWTLDVNRGIWLPPIAPPPDSNDIEYYWNENLKSWQIFI